MLAYCGIDGGGTQTTVAVCSSDGSELARVRGTAGLVDLRNPQRTVNYLAELMRTAADSAGIALPLEALCAGLAGVGNEAERSIVEAAFAQLKVARHVRVVGDDEIAMEGAFGSEPGILLIAGTGCVAYGRGADGRVARVGGWGMVLGDEGGGFAIGRAGLLAALQSADGIGQQTGLLPRLLSAIGDTVPSAIPPWAECATKAEIAALAPLILEMANDGDEMALEAARTQARAAARYVHALSRRLGPWSGTVPVVCHGGTFRSMIYRRMVTDELRGGDFAFEIISYMVDPVAGALAKARLAVVA